MREIVRNVKINFGAKPKFLCKLNSVQFFVEKAVELKLQIGKNRFTNTLRFLLCTALSYSAAPIVCVDVFEDSVNVIPVDG
jgi:hypothetical protein